MLKKRYILSIVICIYIVFGHAILKAEDHPLLDLPISLNVENRSVTDILDTISKYYHVYFSYNVELINKKKKITLFTQKKPLEDVLSALVNDSTIGFVTFDTQVVIYQKDNTLNNHPGNNTEEMYWSLTGEIIDGIQGTKITNAHIYLKKRGIGTISNQDGQFELKVADQHITDELIITYLGYKTETVKTDTLGSKSLTVKLIPAPVQLEEVQVKPLNAEDIIHGMISKISDNYDNKPALYTAFFREYTKQDGTYIKLSEAVLEIYKTSYRMSYSDDHARIVKARKNKENSYPDEINFTVQGGIYYNMQLDIVKNLPSFVHPIEYKKYTYSLKGIESKNGRLFYEIHFKPGKNADDAHFYGKLFIDIETLALASAEFNLSEEGIDYASQAFIRKKPFRYVAYPVYAHYMVDYLRNHGKWRLNNLRSEVQFRVRNKNDEFTSLFTAVSGLLVTNVRKKGVRRFKRREVQRSTDIFVEQVEEYETDFWGSHTIIKPGISIREAYEQLTGRDSGVVTMSEKD